MGNETTRYRQDDAFGQRSAEERHAAEDPLAELARLMGQDDEFAALARSAPRPAAPVRREPSLGAPPPRPAAPSRPAAPPYPAAPRSSAPAPRAPAAPGSFAALAAEVYSDGTPRPVPRSERHSLEDAARDLNRGFARSEPRAPEPRAPEPRAPEPRAPESRSYMPPRPQPTESRLSAPSVDPMSRGVERGRVASAGVDAVSQALGQPFAAEPPIARAPRAPEPAPMVARPAPARPAEPRPLDLDEEAYDYGRSAVEDAGYGADGQEGFDERYEPEEAEDTTPRSSRRLAVIGTVIGLAVIGAAGVYAFRSSDSGPVASGGQPPVIRADQGPNKVVPEPSTETSTDGQKLIYDRVGGNTPTGNERVVSSEEQPVDVSQAAQPQQPRVIQPATGASPTPVQPNSTEPKRVRTLTVRADGSIVEDASPTPVPGAPATVAPTAQPTTNAPIALSSGTAAPINTSPTPLAATPSIVDNVPAAAPRAPTQTAAAPAPSATPAPAGAYVVQIASVRSEAEAQATWRAWQSKYPNVLGGQQMAVRRADLGDRGVYYRAQVGSFANREDANALCQALRAQGGDCMVQRN
ncbi:SPOR domain-containing protein [Ancylobacter sp. G4_0304]|uniref:SPOR domain-containing protein n=1 Tax=Ancylobacter sp. G4_0304 TaxID=3114289 RepID=UPI0039C5E770